MRFKKMRLTSRVSLALLSVLVCGPLLAACPDAEGTLASACPELYAELDRVGLVEALDLAPESVSDAQTVQQLEQYLAAARQPQHKPPELDEKMLDQLIAENYRAAKRKELSFMERLSAWWDSLWDKGDQAGPNVDFWKKFIPTETFARALFYLLSGLLLSLLLVYGWRELQPFLAARRSSVAKAKAKPQKTLTTWPPKLAQLPANLALAKAYAALVRVLTERQKLPDVPGLTHAELAQAFATQAQLESTQRFSGMSAQAATALFTEQAVSPEELDGFLSQANALVAASSNTATSKLAIIKTEAQAKGPKNA